MRPLEYLEILSRSCQAEDMSKITVSLDEEKFRRSIPETERLKREERALRERVSVFRASGWLSRDETHERGV
jgi:hypothetical protein